MSHSPIAPSSAYIWAPPGGCGAWRAMSAQYPELERSEKAEEGTAAHELAARMVHSSSRARVGFPKRDAVIGKIAENGVVFTDAMFDGALIYNDIVTRVMRATGVFGGPNLGIEQRVAAPGIHPELYGTSDFFLYCPQTNTLYVYDFKFGYRVVDAFENWQLMVYAAAIIETLHLNDPALKISLNVVQPRIHTFVGEPDRWDLTVAELQSFIGIIRCGAARAFDPDAECHTGTHCQWCTARHACPAAIKAGFQYVEVTTEAIPVDMTVVQMSQALKVLALAKVHIGSLTLGIEEQLKARARAGETIPGYRVANTYGYSAWDRPVDEILQLGEMYGHDLRKAEVITPNQAEAAGMDPVMVKAFSSKPLRGVKLVADSEQQIRKVFGK